jgi:methylated-DNA-[protein]-cysteine S-methyltransferase
MRATCWIASPIGALSITEDAQAIVGINWSDARARDDAMPSTPLLTEAVRQLQAYFTGRLRRFDLPLRQAGSPFEQRVWAAMSAIPYGETRTYSDLAHTTDSGPRAVGRACGRNSIPIVIPCHRVLARGGLGGYSGGSGLPTKCALLALEGALAQDALPLAPTKLRRSVAA